MSMMFLMSLISAVIILFMPVLAAGIVTAGITFAAAAVHLMVVFCLHRLITLLFFAHILIFFMIFAKKYKI
jgi:hypothetical protein